MNSAAPGPGTDRCHGNEDMARGALPYHAIRLLNTSDAQHANHLDRAHMSVEVRSLARPIRPACDQLGYNNVGVKQPRYCGVGHRDVWPLSHALPGIGCIGCIGRIGFEFFASSVDARALFHDLAKRRNRDGPALARHARALEVGHVGA